MCGTPTGLAAGMPQDAALLHALAARNLVGTGQPVIRTAQAQTQKPLEGHPWRMPLQGFLR